MRTARILFRTDVILCFERAVKIGVISKSAVAVHVGGRHAPRQHLLCNHKPLLHDVPIYTGSYHPVESVGKMVLAHKEFARQKLQRQRVRVVLVDVPQHLRHHPRVLLSFSKASCSNSR